ncbi:hypothetical protein EYF80_029505 [Liparis tanakae]|uniref:Uncharacterized protein n=1 Tax=Liparis tanakae TaxID=230148 RepID=A0A4Z2H5V5_9TELE|nr:hypothetical protein EYF80_029505 [Liparis tanakae]
MAKMLNPTFLPKTVPSSAVRGASSCRWKPVPLQSGGWSMGTCSDASLLPKSELVDSRDSISPD